MDRKYRPSMASVPISPASVISAIDAPTKKSHPVQNFISNESLNKPYMTLYLHE
jgi:hypothetical protein